MTEEMLHYFRRRLGEEQIEFYEGSLDFGGLERKETAKSDPHFKELELRAVTYEDEETQSIIPGPSRIQVIEAFAGDSKLCLRVYSYKSNNRISIIPPRGVFEMIHRRGGYMHNLQMNTTGNKITLLEGIENKIISVKEDVPLSEQLWDIIPRERDFTLTDTPEKYNPRQIIETAIQRVK